MMAEITGLQLRDILLAIAQEEKQKPFDKKCPDEVELQKYLRGNLKGRALLRVRRHILNCANCSLQAAGLINLIHGQPGVTDEAILLEEAEMLEDARKETLRSLVASFLLKAYPNELSYFEQLWRSLKTKSLSAITVLSSQSIAKPLGDFAFGVKGGPPGANVASALVLVASVLEKEGIDDPSSLPASQIKKVIERIGKKEKIPKEVVEKLLEHLGNH